MFSKFDEDAQKVLIMSRKEMLELKHPYVGSEHLLLAILNSNTKVTKFLNNYGVTYNKFKSEIINIIGRGNSENTWFLYTPLLKKIIENAILDSKEENTEITVSKLLESLLEEGEGVANRILIGMNIDVDLLYEKVVNKFSNKSNAHKSKLIIEEYGVDLNKKTVNEDFDPVIGREEKLNQVIEILLRRRKNNPLLIGEAGVGKTAIVEELARRIDKGLVPNKLKNTRIISLSMPSVVSGTKYRGEFEERVSKMIREIENSRNIIIFIDEIHTIVGAGGAEGAIDASNILKPYLARGQIRIIGATTKQEYTKHIEKDKALDRRFQKIYIEETTDSETKIILNRLKPIYENYHGIIIDDSLIDSIISLSNKYINFGKQPDKSIDILDEVCTKTLMTDNQQDKEIRKTINELGQINSRKNMAIIDHNFKMASNLKKRESFLENKLKEINKNKIELKKEATINSVYNVIENKTKIPINKIMNSNINIIKKELKKEVVGQDEAIDNIISLTMNNNFNKKTLSMLFVGKSGVGKTFLAQEYARKIYPKDAFVRIDMSEYSDRASVARIVGSNPGYVGYEDKDSVIYKIKDNPYSVILLDEIEKAHPSVIKLFLQVFDEGYMTSSSGEKIDFSKSIVFMTSNLGCDKNRFGFIDNKYNIVLDQVKNFLGIELVNRIDKIILFNNLSKKDINKIINKKIKSINNIDCDKYIKLVKKKFNYKEMNIRDIDRIIKEVLLDTVC